MSGMEVTISLFGFLALTQLFTIGLLWRTNLHIHARLDAVAAELRAEVHALAGEMRNEFRRVDQRLGKMEHRLGNVETGSTMWKPGSVT